MRSIRVSLLIAGIILLTPAGSRLDAQATAASALAFGGVDKFLDRIETVNLYWGTNIWQRGGSPGRYSVPTKDEFGLEFSVHVGSYGPEIPALRQAEDKKIGEAMAKANPRTPQDTAAVLAKLYPKWKPGSVTIKKHFVVQGKDTIVAAVDSEFVATPNDVSVPKRLDLDFAIGYGQLNGLKTNTPYELRGYVRELPSVSLYATAWTVPNLGVYFGFRTGVITLQDAQLFVPKDSTRKVFSLSATSFEAGIAVGIVIGQGDGAPSFTFEVSPMWRNFNSIVSNPAENTPPGMPHSMDVSGASLSVGIMFPLPKSK